MPPTTPPTLREERRLLRLGHEYVAGMDEVGRGALAGPVSVGVVVVDLTTRTAPMGVRDSKLLTPAAREAMVPRLRRWGVARAVGHAEPSEIDAIGIIAALRLAARRALAALPVLPTCVLLDGNHDWLTPPAPAVPPAPPPPVGALELFEVEPLALPAETGPSVVTRIKADMACAAVAAASVLAKVERDAMMVARSSDFPHYGWSGNKGYSAPEHIEALRLHGPCVQHRRSWSLPGVGAGPGAMALELSEDAVELGLPADVVDLASVVEAGELGLPVEAGEVGLPVEAGEVGLPVEAGEVGLPVEAGEVGLPVEAGELGLPGEAVALGVPAQDPGPGPLAEAAERGVPAEAPELPAAEPQSAVEAFAETVELPHEDGALFGKDFVEFRA